MTTYNLKGKTALVTGASSGIGLGVAQSLAEEGVNLFLISRDEERLKESVENLRSSSDSRIEFLAGDVSDISLAEKSKDLVDSLFGECNILINNSGGPPMGNFLDFSVKEWESAYKQNLFSIINFTKNFYPDMQKNNWGRIINISSTLAKEPTPQMVLSATMRAGVSAFSKAVSSEMAPFGVTINTICPGGVLTQRMKNLVETSAKNQKKDFEEVLKESVNSIPLGRFATTEEFSKIVLFLVSEHAGYITGVSLMADGGLTKGIF